MYVIFVGVAALAAFSAVATVVGIGAGKCIKQRGSYAAYELPACVELMMMLGTVQDIMDGRPTSESIVLARGQVNVLNPGSSRWQTRPAPELVGPGYAPDAAAFAMWFQLRPDGPRHFVCANPVLDGNIGLLVELSSSGGQLGDKLVLTVEDGYVVPTLLSNAANIG